MCDEEELKFESAEQEAQHWKQLAIDYQLKYREVKDELEEFQVNSRELEVELEAQLVQAEQQNKELKTVNSRLQMECEGLREKLENVQNASNHTITELQEELQQIKAHKDDLLKYIRDLEQTNDDLERAKRATIVSLEDFEGRLNQAIERNAFLESELDDKEAMAITVQRLKDEARDLKYEMQVRSRQQPYSLQEPDNDRCCEKISSPIDSNKLTAESETQTGFGSPLRTANNQLCTTGNPLTPSARISALNIVGDLLRKVGALLVVAQILWCLLRKTTAVILDESYCYLLSRFSNYLHILPEALESKLASCRNYVKESPRTYQGKTPHGSPRAKRTNRGISGSNHGYKMSA